MKKLLVVAVMLMSAGIANAIDASLIIPNLEATWFYSFTDHNNYGGASSKFAYVGDFDTRLGFYNENTALGISYDLKKLSKLGIRVGFAWSEDWSLNIGAGANINFNTQKWGWNLMSVVFKATFDGTKPTNP